MLIRSSLISLLMAASLASAANCGSSSEKSPQGSGSTLTPIVVPTPRPTPAPKSIDLKLLPDESACSDVYKLEAEASGALQFQFNDLVSEAVLHKYRVACRLAGVLNIPHGFRLDPSVSLSAVIQGELRGPIDNFTGRLKFSLGRYTSRDFQLVEYTETDSSNKAVKMDLQVQLPEDLPFSCSEDLVWPVSLFVESTINGRAASRIEQMKLDSLKLLPVDCNP